MKTLPKKRIMSNITITFFIFSIITFTLIVCCLLCYPKITLDDKKVEIEKGSTFDYNGYHAIFLGRDVSSDVKISSNIEDEFGTYTVTYSITKLFFKTSVNLEVKVVDKESPSISLVGDKEINVCKLEDYVEPGFSAYDNVDKDITSRVEVLKNNDYIYYKVSDTFGNETSIGRKINIVDDESPVISLKGGDTIYLTIGSTYQEQGFSATDNCLGDITDKVTIENNVDTSVVGTYSVIYKVSDNKNNTEVKRTVYVIDESDSKGVIYLTFDDGPNSNTTKILDILKKYDIKATFFVTKSGSDDIILREYQEGHTIGLHTYSHSYDIYKSVDTYFDDLNKIQERVTRITGVSSKYIRFPGGSSNTVSKSRCKGIMTTLTSEVEFRGYRYYDWNALVEDAGACAKKSVTDKKACVLSYFKKTISYNKVNVVLLHDIKSYTADSLEDMIIYAKAQGYIFKKIDDNTPEIHQKVNN